MQALRRHEPAGKTFYYSFTSILIWGLPVLQLLGTLLRMSKLESTSVTLFKTRRSPVFGSILTLSEELERSMAGVSVPAEDAGIRGVEAVTEAGGGPAEGLAESCPLMGSTIETF